MSGFSALPSFGLVFSDFLKSIGAETSAIAFITSAFFCAFSFAGLFSGSLFNRFGLRNVGLVGGFLYFIGSVMQIFVNSTFTLLIAFSVIQGIGFGFIVPTSYTTFNNYFVKNRVMWMSFAQSLIGVGTMVYPVLMQRFLDWYGFRGCLTVLAAINSHAVLGMLLMQPVEWHMRRVPIEPDEKLSNKNPANTTTTIAINSDGDKKVTSDRHHLSPSTPLILSRHGSRNLMREDNLKKISSRTSSIANLGNWSGAMVVIDASPEMSKAIGSRKSSVYRKPSSILDQPNAEKTFCQVVVDFLDLTLMKQPIYVNIVLGISFALYSDITFFTLQPLYMFELGFDKVRLLLLIEKLELFWIISMNPNIF